MQNKVESIKEHNVIDFEFEISGEKFAELDWNKLVKLKTSNHEAAIAVEKTLMKTFWEITSLEELKEKLYKNLSFLDLIKIKLEFGEKSFIKNKSGHINFPTKYTDTVFNAIENVPKTFSEKLFGWIYYKNKDENLETFRFIINIDNGEIKYFD